MKDFIESRTVTNEAIIEFLRWARVQPSVAGEYVHVPGKFVVTIQDVPEPRS